eukprot:GILJ01026336.1.p2 GENE.GILJ01026336.1~~GILJ01026336.1.p2  ORF type:complete len:270 (+),score=37.77 GILJ01026336.1:1206-2015(+)
MSGHASCCCCVTVEQGNLAIIENLGKFVDVLPPGCHITSCVESVKGTLSLKSQYTTARIQSVTSDQADVVCVVGIMYRVMPENCHLAFYRLSNPTGQIQNFVVSAIRPLIRSKTLDEIYLERDELSNVARSELVEKMAEFGYEIMDVLFVHLDVEGRIKNSMNQQMTQKFNRELSEVQQQTSNIRQLALSHANVEIERLDGYGTAEARKVLASAFSSRDHQEGAVEVASETEIMSMMLMMQYYDMLKDVKKTLTYFMPMARPGPDSDTE